MDKLDKIFVIGIILLLSVFTCYALGVYLFANQDSSMWSFGGRIFISIIFFPILIIYTSIYFIIKGDD